ncbi:MAG: hypothetical protein ACSLE1_03295 [Sphingobium sp.]
MTDEDFVRLDDSRPLLGPTLAEEFRLLEALDRLPDCAICPAAQWYKLEDENGTKKQLECFCTQFHKIMYKDGYPFVTRCDAREDAIKNLSPLE